MRPVGIRRWDGKWLFKAPDGAGTRMIGIHRCRLHQALVDGQQADLVTGTRIFEWTPPGSFGAQAVNRG